MIYSFTQLSLSDTILEANREDSNSPEAAAPKVPIKDDDVDMAEASEEKKEEDDEENQFEIDVLNSNLTMKPFTELIKKMYNEIFELTKFPSTNMPPWMKLLLEAFKSSEDAINVQLHIAKLITNYPRAFETYADSWLLPLIELVIKGPQYGEPINYLVQDLCVVLVFWGKTTDIPSPRSFETKRILFEFLVSIRIFLSTNSQMWILTTTDFSNF
jgi:DNA-dependent protein kinase catalytic subunit